MAMSTNFIAWVFILAYVGIKKEQTTGGDMIWSFDGRLKNNNYITFYDM